MGALNMAAAKAYANRRSFMVMNEVSIFNIFQTHIFFPGQRIYFDKINLRVLFERSEFFGRVGNIFPNSNHKHMHTTHTNTHQRHICDQKRFYKLISNSIWNIILIILPRLSFQFLVYVPGGVGSSSIRLSSHFFPFPPIQNNNNNINNRKIHRHSDFPTIDARLSCDSTMCVYVRCAMYDGWIGDGKTRQHSMW